jgi:hypothetical protein
MVNRIIYKLDYLRENFHPKTRKIRVSLTYLEDTQMGQHSIQLQNQESTNQKGA